MFVHHLSFDFTSDVHIEAIFSSNFFGSDFLLEGPPIDLEYADILILFNEEAYNMQFLERLMYVFRPLNVKC